MDEANIDQIVILSGNSLALYKQYPERIIPFWGDYSISVESFAEQAEQKLNEGYKGLGEISLRHAPVPDASVETKNPADSGAMKKIADIAAKHNILVTVHHETDFDELERLLDHNKNAKIVLAHAGRMNYDVPFRIDRLMSTHPNLYVDLSQQIPLFKTKIEQDEAYYLLLANGKINPIWKHLLEKFPDRFFVGGDYYVEDRNSLKRESTELRKMLGQLSSSVAEKIAYKNILGLIPG
jgi:predicted TIM-barrel fold metal-dependent hydrolase